MIDRGTRFGNKDSLTFEFNSYLGGGISLNGFNYYGLTLAFSGSDVFSDLAGSIFSLEDINLAYLPNFEGTVNATSRIGFPGTATLTNERITPVPLLGALPLLAGGLGILGVFGARRRRHKRDKSDTIYQLTLTGNT